MNSQLLSYSLASSSGHSLLIDPARLAAKLGALASRIDIVALAECDSTNAQLALRAQAGAASGTLLVADRQTAGRGRRGRQWMSTPADSLTFSLLWRFAAGAESQSPSNGARRRTNISGLSLAVGLAVVRATDALGLPGLLLKWPNDLLLRRRDGAGWGKAGGILIELASGQQGTAAVIGIGLNLRAPGDKSAAAFDMPAAGLDELEAGGEASRHGAADSVADSVADSATNFVPDCHLLLAEVLRQLVAILDRFAVDGLAPFRADWEARHAWAGVAVRLMQDGACTAEGRCLGIDDAGALRVDTGQGVESWLSGDVSLRTP